MVRNNWASSPQGGALIFKIASQKKPKYPLYYNLLEKVYIMGAGTHRTPSCGVKRTESTN